MATTLSELVKRHGTPIRVRCSHPSYPPFTIVRKKNEGEFLVRYDDDREETVCECDWLTDYSVAETEAANTG